MTQANRNHAFDNLRTLMVLFVVLLHACCAYAENVPWWHAQDAESLIFNVISLLIDGFALPILFFVSGLFALPSLERHGTGGFLKGKLKRLGIPLLLLPAFYLPTMVYTGYVHRAENPLSFFAYWINWMRSLADWDFVLIIDPASGAPYADVFATHHLWFVAMLLVFFVGYALLKSVLPKLPTLGMGWLIALAATGILTLFAILNGLVQDWAWALLGPFLLFQPTRIPVYLGMFLFGVLARPHIDRSRPFPGPWWVWLIVFLISEGLMLIMVSALMTPGPAIATNAVIHGVLRAGMAVSAAGLFVNLFTDRLGTPSPWRESLAVSSYAIYLWHMPMVVFVQACLVPTPLPLAIKALLAFLVPTFLFWFLNRGAARTFPWQWVGFTAVVFLGFSLGS